MRPLRIPFEERTDLGTTILVGILTLYFGLTGVLYFIESVMVTQGHRGRAVIGSVIVLVAAGGILLYTAGAFWKRRRNALLWGFASLGLVVAVWIKWPGSSEFFSTSLAAACLIWLAY